MSPIRSTDYRRGIQGGNWQRLWHFSKSCPSYPNRNFIVERTRPSDDDLCSRCESLSG